MFESNLLCFFDFLVRFLDIYEMSIIYLFEIIKKEEENM